MANANQPPLPASTPMPTLAAQLAGHRLTFGAACIIRLLDHHAAATGLVFRVADHDQTDESLLVMIEQPDPAQPGSANVVVGALALRLREGLYCVHDFGNGSLDVLAWLREALPGGCNFAAAGAKVHPTAK